MSTISFTPKERACLAICQASLPDSLEPYAEIAKQCGMSEEEVINLLQSLKDSGVIRRFGATIRHQKAGYTENIMAAWIATEEEAEQWGPKAAENPNVSHAYYRPSSAPDWPYTLYTMVHGRSPGECQKAIEELAKSWPLKRYAALKSIRELKKTSMKYFE